MVWSLAAFKRAIVPALNWLSARWQWILAGAGLLIAFFLGTRCSAKKIYVASSGAEEEAEAARKIDKIKEDSVRRKEEVVASSEKERIDELRSERDLVDNVGDDTEAVNAYLRMVGDDMRK